MIKADLFESVQYIENFELEVTYLSWRTDKIHSLRAIVIFCSRRHVRNPVRYGRLVDGSCFHVILIHVSHSCVVLSN